MKKDDLTVMRILYLLQKHKNSLNSYIISNKNKQRIKELLEKETLHSFKQLHYISFILKSYLG